MPFFLHGLAEAVQLIVFMKTGYWAIRTISHKQLATGEAGD
jgi:hypothetical protein